MKKQITIALALLAVSCQWKDGMVEPHELGVAETQAALPCTAGTYTLSILADGDFTVTLPSDAPWLTFSGAEGRSVTGDGDTGIVLSYEMNRGLVRSAVVSVTRGRKECEVAITQAGVLSAGIEFAERSVTVAADGGTRSVKVVTLCEDSDLSFSVEYEGASGWVGAVSKTNNYITFSFIANTSGESRRATIVARSISDGSLSDVCQVYQLGSGETLSDLGIDALGTLAPSEGDYVVDGAYVIEGIVIGDNAEGNGAPNRNLSPSLQDNTLSDRTVYVQAEDGSAGVKMTFDTVADNILRRYDKVRILLDGLILTRHADPACYDLSGLTSASILGAEAGSRYSVVAKERYIEELTDADLYTFVTLRDCEIPIRKGPFVPIDLRHTYVINRYPMPVRDIRGGSLYLMTNLTAAWQRDGKGIPEGSGDISGILVHETCDNYEWDTAEAQRRELAGTVTDYITETGSVGRYQIRPVSRADIALSDNFSDGFSGMVMEIRYYNKSYDNLVRNVRDNTIWSTYPAVEYPMSDSSVKGFLESVSGGTVAGVASYRDWTLLGPIAGGVLTDISSNGVHDYFGNSAHFYPYTGSSVNSYTTGLLLSQNGSSWYCTRWSTAKYWRATFSTEGLTADNFPLSVQFGTAQGVGSVTGAPRYWAVEYSTVGDVWVKVADYTVPDFPIISNRKIWQCPGPKYMTFNLPEDSGLLGKDQVFVRLRPTSDKAGTASSYDGGTIDSSQPNQLNYFAIRYNK